MTRTADPATREITVRGVCLGALITIVFMAANIYLGLRTGMTFASSVPAAIISMSALKLFRDNSILENNIVQTQASAAGTLCNVILVLPGLLMMHQWQHVSMGQTFVICLLGGLLGVLCSIPLRRVLVTDSSLPFPEGVAAAEVLRSGHETRARGGGLRLLVLGTLASSAFSALTSATRLLPAAVDGTQMIGRSVLRAGVSLSPALIGVGYLVRLGPCLALLLGLGLAWGVAVPVLTAISPIGKDPAILAEQLWSDKVRLIGAGIIGVGGLWTAFILVPALARAMRGSGARKTTTRRERLSARRHALLLGLAAAGLSCGVALYLGFGPERFAGDRILWLVPLSAAGVVLFGVLMATACGYLAGLLGSSSSPISGIGILTVLVATVSAAFLVPARASEPTVGLALCMTAIVVTMASIANDNLQDLKTGQIVGATPWRQQVALAIGVAIGAAVVGPVLNVLDLSYGFAGALPRPNMDAHAALPAPQAALMTQIARGIAERSLPWGAVALGAALGVVFICLETYFGRRGGNLPAMTVGIGMYLPSSVVATIALGGILGWLSERGAREGERRRRGVLVASGLLVGESLVGIAVAAVDASFGRSGVLVFAPHAGRAATALSVLVFVAMFGGLYRAMRADPNSPPEDQDAGDGEHGLRRGR